MSWPGAGGSTQFRHRPHRQRLEVPSKASFQDLHLTKYVDKSSPNLMLYTANGKHFPTATLTVRKASENPLEYLVITLTNVLVSSVSTGGSGGEDRLTENVTLNFAQVKVEYKEQTEKGAAGATSTMAWNIAQNAAA